MLGSLTILAAWAIFFALLAFCYYYAKYKL